MSPIETTKEQERACHYYLAYQDEINRGHMGEAAAIADNHVVGYYKTELDAVRAMLDKGYKLGSFNISKCRPVGEPAHYIGGFSSTGAW
jgi:hypothetical protein